MNEDDIERNGRALDVAAPGPVPPPLRPGDPAPWFRARSDINPDFKFSSLGGRHIVLSYVGSLSRSDRAPLHDGLLQGAGRFGAFTTALLLVSGDPADAGARVPAQVSGTRYLFDDDQRLAGLLGVNPAQGPTTFVIDERLTILAVVTELDVAQHVRLVFALFDGLPDLPPDKPSEPQAPVLTVPFVFEPDLCKALIGGFERHGGQQSGFMVERDGLTVMKFDYQHKRRSDWTVTDNQLIKRCHTRILRRLVPEILRAYQFNASRIERNLVACYRADDQGHFNRHRDNTTKGTAHRRFAVSINLNSEAYEGGDLVFPEFGRARFRPPTGGACVFSCSLLHEATMVTRGKRYVFVPFLYDDEAAQVRQRNEQYLTGDDQGER